MVTSPSTPDHPDQERVVEHKVVPSSPYASADADQTGDISHIEWATRILDEAVMDNNFKNSKCNTFINLK